MLSELKNENESNTILKNECKYDNQYKKRRLSNKTPEKNRIINSLPTSSPPGSPTSIQSFNNIVIKTPNISRILSHLSIRTPKKNFKNGTSSLNLLNDLHRTKTEPDPLLTTKELFLQTPQPSQPSSPSAAMKKDQGNFQLPKELLQSKFNGNKSFRNVTTPKSIRSLNSTPTKNLKAMNLDFSLSPSKGSDDSYNSSPTSPTSFLITTPTKGKNKAHFIGSEFKDNKPDIQDLSWFKSFTSSYTSKDNNEEDIFKYKRLNIPSILNPKSNDYSYREYDKTSLSSITDDSSSCASTSTTSSSYNFFNRHLKKHLKKNKKGHPSKLSYTNRNKRYPLSPEPSFLRTNSLLSSSLEKDEFLNKSVAEKHLSNFNTSSSSSNINILNTIAIKEVNPSESLASSYSSSYSSSIPKNNNLSFLSSVNHDIFNSSHHNHSNNPSLKLDMVSEIESITDTIPISDISMFIDEEEDNDFIPLNHQKESNVMNVMNEEIITVTNEMDTFSKNNDKTIKINTNTNTNTNVNVNNNNNTNNNTNANGNVNTNATINTNANINVNVNTNTNTNANINVSVNANTLMLNTKEKSSCLTTSVTKKDHTQKTSSLYKGFLNIDGIWEDPSLSQCEARNLKEKGTESEIDEDTLERSSGSKSFPSTPKMRYNGGSSSGPNTPRYGKELKTRARGHLRKSSQPLLLNMDGTSSPVTLERLDSIPSLNSSLKQSFGKNKQLTAVNKLNMPTKSSKLCRRRANSISSTCSSSSNTMILSSTKAYSNNTNNNNKLSTQENMIGWNGRRRRRCLVRSNSVSDISESLSSERKRSFSSLDEEDEYTSDASSIRRSPSSLRKLNARRKGKEKLANLIHYKNKAKQVKENRKNSASLTITSTASSTLVVNKGKNRVGDEDMNRNENGNVDRDGDINIDIDVDINENPNQDDFMMSNDSDLASKDPDCMSISADTTYTTKSKEEPESERDQELDKPIESHRNSLISDTNLTNLEFNEIHQKKKHENKENVHLLCNGKDGLKEKDISSLSPPPIVPREMIFVDEKGNIYNEQNYKYLSNYTKAVIADELSKRYCRIPLTEILVSNMPEYRQYFDENGQLKPNNFIYVDNEEEEEDINTHDHPIHSNGVVVDMGGVSTDKTKMTPIPGKLNENHIIAVEGKREGEREAETGKEGEDIKVMSLRCNSPISNINLIRNDTNTTIEFRTEPLNAEKEMIFKSTMSPKGKQEWQDITKMSLQTPDDGEDDEFDSEEEEEDDDEDWDIQNQPMEEEGKGKEAREKHDMNRLSTKAIKSPKRKERGKGKGKKEEEEEEDVNFVEKIDDKITIIYRTHESKYQLVIPIKLNIYNKKDTLL